MLIRVCTSKIHRATVTEADLNYVGSITIDEALLEASGIKQFQMVNVHNLSNAVVWQTYVIRGERGSGVICLNGPPARHFHPGDKVIVLAEAYIEPSEITDLQLTVVIVEDDENKRFKQLVKTSSP
ncbi:MAG TPA: aspartate 1-decarboxylase [Terriglobales bacterium]|nr:aspartate 1-decarboxylase [Terriglobales bacterium]